MSDEDQCPVCHAFIPDGVEVFDKDEYSGCLRCPGCKTLLRMIPVMEIYLEPVDEH